MGIGTLRRYYEGGEENPLPAPVPAPAEVPVEVVPTSALDIKVKDLSEFLAGISDGAEIRKWQALDSRTSAAELYDERIAVLEAAAAGVTTAEEDDGA